MTSQDVLLLEKELSFQSLTNEDLMTIAMSIVKRVQDENKKNVRIRAVLNHDIVFQYLMNNKRGDVWLNRKQRTVEHFGHSSFYIYKVNEETGQYEEYKNNDEYVICGGGFPLIVQDQIVGSLLVSGLEHEQDHQFIVDALRNFQNKIAFASDIDETLFFHNREENYKFEDLMKIKKFQQNGHYFGVCTGRPMCFIGNVKDLGLDFYIMSSGAVLLDRNFRIIEEHPMAYLSAKQLYEQYKDCSTVIVQTANPTTSFGNKRENKEINFTKINSIDEIKDEILYGISIVVDSEEEASRIAQEINHNFTHLIGHHNRNSIDVVSRHCSKGIAVKHLKEMLRVQTIASIGDSYNDVSMLKESDMSFTFHSSDERVKNHAHKIVHSIAEAIMMLMEEKK